jgi:hypothetical protein
MECVGTGSDKEGLTDSYTKEACVWKKPLVQLKEVQGGSDIHIQQSGIDVFGVPVFWGAGVLLGSMAGDTDNDLSWLKALVLREQTSAAQVTT